MKKPLIAFLMLASFLLMAMVANPVQQAEAAAGTTGAISTKSSTVALNVAVAFELTSLTAGADYGIIIDTNDNEKYFNWTASSDETSRIMLITFDSGDVSSNLITVSLTNGSTAKATDLDSITLTVTETTDIISTAFLIGLFGVLFVLGVLVIIMKAVRKN